MSVTDEGALRRGIVETALEIEQLGINQGTSGNVSARFGDGLLITPSSVPARDLHDNDIVFLRLKAQDDDDVFRIARPSSEWRIHRDILHECGDVHAVVHTHSMRGDGACDSRPRNSRRALHGRGGQRQLDPVRAVCGIRQSGTVG